MRLIIPAAGAVCCDVPGLMQLFEGLGENCDLGVVQRAAGIEPLGLLRFGTCTAVDLARLLRTRFKSLGGKGDLWLEEMGAEREYWVRSRSSSYSAHTERYAGQDDAAVVLASIVEKTQYLKSRLIEDLSRARRLLVFKGAAEPAAIREILAALRGYGQNSLLWICLADVAHRPGSVQRLSDGLLRGNVSRYGTYDTNPSVPVEEWVAVCAKAYRLWRNAAPPTASVTNLIAAALGTGSCCWLTDGSAVTVETGEVAPSGGAVFEHRLERGESEAVYRALMPIDAGGDFVMSAWVRIPSGFRGSLVGLQIADAGEGAAWWSADVKSRGNWQRIWFAASLPAGARSIACDVIASGIAGDVFHSASWCLERGTQPSGYGFPIT